MKTKLKLLVLACVAGALMTGAAGAASSPTVLTGAATSIKQSSAVLHGTVNPNGADTGYQFQWGLTTAYGLTGKSRSAGRGTKPVAVRFAPDHLLPGTIYHYRLVALSRFGGTVGRDRTLKTAGSPPAQAATGPATQPGTSSVTLTGEVNPNHQNTTWYFNYGLSTAYGSRTVSGVIPAGTTPVNVSQRIVGLASGTIFHYQLVAVNRNVPAFGADSTFMTFSNPAPVPRVHARTKPHRARHRPFVFTTSGRVSGPSSIPNSFACAGTVIIRFLVHRHGLQRTLAPVAPDCSFSAQTIFEHRPGHGNAHRKVRLRVLIHFLGDGYLAPARARVEHLVMG